MQQNSFCSLQGLIKPAESIQVTGGSSLDV
jgi:hypothetical protein